MNDSPREYVLKTGDCCTTGVMDTALGSEADAYAKRTLLLLAVATGWVGGCAAGAAGAACHCCGIIGGAEDDVLCAAGKWNC